MAKKKKKEERPIGDIIADRSVLTEELREHTQGLDHALADALKPWKSNELAVMFKDDEKELERKLRELLQNNNVKLHRKLRHLVIVVECYDHVINNLLDGKQRVAFTHACAAEYKRRVSGEDLEDRE